MRTFAADTRKSVAAGNRNDGCALGERTISFTFDESGSAPADNTGDSNSSAGGDTTPNAASDTALRAVATVTIAKE